MYDDVEEFVYEEVKKGDSHIVVKYKDEATKRVIDDVLCRMRKVGVTDENTIGNFINASIFFELPGQIDYDSKIYGVSAKKIYDELNKRFTARLSR